MGEHARAVVERLPGASSVDVNTLTGSITILYEKDAFCLDNAVATLTAHDLIVTHAIEAPSRERAPSRVDVAYLGRVAVEAAAGVVVEKLVERSAIRLIAALI